VLEITDSAAVTRAALDRITLDREMPDDERASTVDEVTEDTAEALAAIVDPFDLVSEVPGVELAQASWSSEEIDYDPDSPDWGLDEDDVEAADDEVGEGAGGRA